MAHDYCIAIDVGTSRVAAATASLDPGAVPVAAPLPLGRASDSAPAVAYLGEDGELLFGDAAERRGVSEPHRLIREFKRSLGDEAPLVIAGSELSAHGLFASTVSSVLETASQREGGTASHVVLTHPVAWGEFRIGLVRSALEEAGTGPVTMISEPEAAARHYEATHEIASGQVVVVYDLGGGTFDIAALRKGDDGRLEPVGAPIGLDDLGGADFDDAVIRHVVRSCDVAAGSGDPETRLALAQLRRECVEAKEALSFDTEARIPVLIPPNPTSVRLTRAEFEGMIAPALERTAQAVEQLLDDAGVAVDEVAAILLVGGSSRIPLVTQLLSERFAAPIALDADPKSSMALGAARWGLAHDGALVPAAARDAAAAPIAPEAPESEHPDSPLLLGQGVDDPAPETGGRRWYAAALVAGAAVIAGGIILGGSVAAGLRPVDVRTVSSMGDSADAAGEDGRPDAFPRPPQPREAFSSEPARPGGPDPAATMRDRAIPARGSAGQSLLPRVGVGLAVAPARPTTSAAATSPSSAAPATPATPRPSPSTPSSGGSAVAPTTPTPTPSPTPTEPTQSVPTPSEPTPSDPTPSTQPAPEPAPAPADPAGDPVPVAAVDPLPVSEPSPDAEPTGL